MKMSSGAVVAMVVTSMVFSILGSLVFLNMHYHDKAVTFEESIVTLSKSSESLLSNGTMAILDKASIKDSYANDFKESLRISMEGRYQNDSGVAMKWIQEQNSTLSVALYQDISSYIEGMRTDFKIAQDRTIDQCRAYRVMQRKSFSSLFLGDFPSEDFDTDSLCEIVSDSKTREAFSTKSQTSIL